MESVRKDSTSVDSGYAWVVCGAISMQRFLYCMVVYGIGMFYIIFKEHFREDSGVTAFVSSLMIVGLSLVGRWLRFPNICQLCCTEGRISGSRGEVAWGSGPPSPFWSPSNFIKKEKRCACCFLRICDV